MDVPTCSFKFEKAADAAAGRRPYLCICINIYIHDRAPHAPAAAAAKIDLLC